MKVAIIGPTGAGKTTLVNLLMRFYEVTSGDILIDGVSIKDMSPQELRAIFGMILQETWVINGSLRENIVYNLKDVDENRLQDILEETNLSHYVSTLPDGLDTIAHRLSTIKNADLIIVMKDGNIVEIGNHDSLMAVGGLYSEIYNSQFN